MDSIQGNSWTGEFMGLNSSQPQSEQPVSLSQVN